MTHFHVAASASWNDYATICCDQLDIKTANSDPNSNSNPVVLKLGTMVPLGSAKQFQEDCKEVADI